MANYLLWMMWYSDALRSILRSKADTSNMSYEQMLKILESPENLKENKELVDFLESLGTSHLSVEERAEKLKQNYCRFFNKAAA